jgi:N6-L-threonylcarbamoyladenine synthase
LKTSLLYKLRGMATPLTPEQIADLAAGYQEAIVQVLVMKALAALKQESLSAIAVVGGVSANSRLRTVLRERAERGQIRLSLPPMEFCTDNAAMIASAGRHRLVCGEPCTSDFDIDPMDSSMTLGGTSQITRSYSGRKEKSHL